MKLNFLKVLMFLACFSSFLLFPINSLYSQDDPYGVNDEAMDEMQLDSDLQPRESLVGIINIALSFLGLIAVIIVIYGGFVWMTSGGNEEKINNAKKILKNGLIGLVIVLLSWGIVTWLLGVFSDSEGGPGFTDPSQPSIDPGWGAIGSCTIDSVYPEPGQKDVPRNTSIMMSFKEELDPSSVCVTEKGGSDSFDCSQESGWINPDNIEIEASHQENNLINAKARLTEDKKTIVVSPQVYLGTSNGYTDYTITISGFKKEDGEFMLATCSSDWFSWTFEVSDKIDLTPPKVVSGGIFPPPDNKRDGKVSLESENASGNIEVFDCLTPYQAGEILNASSIEGSASIESTYINNNYNENYTTLELTAGTGGQVQLKGIYDDDIESLGVSTWQDNQVVFSNFYNLTLELEEDYESGNQWEIEVQPRVLADTLTISSTVYSFTETGEENNSIAVPSECNVSQQAENIYNVINLHSDIDVNLEGSNIELTARVAGSSGNSINLTTTNSEALDITPMSGGSDSESGYETNDMPDQPRNTTIQINFDKAMNPLTMSGNSSNLEDSIKVVNLENDGEIVDGTFYINNNYQTVEFVSDNECGENGCGETIYCLPENSHIEVQLVAAPLQECSNDDDCAISQPFTQCNASDLNHPVCQDNDGNYLPTSDGFSGVMDTSFNSLDGNRDGSASGPQTFYDENIGNTDYGDNFKWSFYITDEIILDPPKITSIHPNQGDSIVGEEDIKIVFDSLMRSHTLKTGSTITTGPQGSVEHKRINLFSGADTVGYWIRSENIDSDLSGDPDYTKVNIKHSGLSPSTSWRSQVGSGVENIYQNCFKPSASVNCLATESNPSCCFNQPTSELNPDGNCP